MFTELLTWIFLNILTDNPKNVTAEKIRTAFSKILENIESVVTAAGTGLYKGNIEPTSNVPGDSNANIFLIATPGTYVNFKKQDGSALVLVENSFGFIFRTNNGFVLNSVIIPQPNMTAVNEAIVTMNNFIRDFAVTTDIKFDSSSKNPIANSAVTPLADALSSFLESDKVDVNTTDSKLGYIKNDATIVAGNENRYIEITDLASFKYLNYEGYKAVANTNSQELYSSVLAVKSDGSKENLLGMFNTSRGQGAQVRESFNILIPINTIKILVGWSVWGVSDSVKISLSNDLISKKDSVKKYIDENLSPLEIVFSEPLNLKFDKNYAYDLIELFSSKNISIDSDFESNKIGNVSILKFKGGSLRFDSNIIIDNGSDIYNPNVGNMIYVIWEYQSARAIIKNSNNKSIINRLITQTFFADFNVPNSSYDNYTANVGTKPTVDYGSFTIVDNKLKSLSNADNLLTFQLQNYNDFEFTTNVVVANMLNIGINDTVSSNVSIRKYENKVIYTNEAGQSIITSYVFPSNNNFKVRGVFKNGYFSLFINDNIVLSNVKLKIIGINFFLDFYNSASYVNGEFDDIEIKEFL